MRCELISCMLINNIVWNILQFIADTYKKRWATKFKYLHPLPALICFHGFIQNPSAITSPYGSLYPVEISGNLHELSGSENGDVVITKWFTRWQKPDLDVRKCLFIVLKHRSARVSITSSFSIIEPTRADNIISYGLMCVDPLTCCSHSQREKYFLQRKIRRVVWNPTVSKPPPKDTYIS